MPVKYQSSRHMLGMHSAEQVVVRVHASVSLQHPPAALHLRIPCPFRVSFRPPACMQATAAGPTCLQQPARVRGSKAVGWGLLPGRRQPDTRRSLATTRRITSRHHRRRPGAAPAAYRKRRAAGTALQGYRLGPIVSIHSGRVRATSPDSHSARCLPVHAMQHEQPGAALGRHRRKALGKPLACLGFTYLHSGTVLESMYKCMAAARAAVRGDCASGTTVRGCVKSVRTLVRYANNKWNCSHLSHTACMLRYHRTVYTGVL